MSIHKTIEEKLVSNKLKEPKLKLLDIIEIIENSTILNALQSHLEPNWVERFFSKVYNQLNVNEYWIKSFLIINYPLSIIELLLKNDEIFKFRNLKGLIVDNQLRSDTKIFAAYVRQISQDQNLVVINEQFFNFLFDFHLIEPTTIKNNQNLDNEELNQLIANYEEEFYSNFKNNYNGFSINKFKEFSETEYGNVYKLKLLLTLLFILSHEMAHVYLGHTKKHVWGVELESSDCIDSSDEIPFNDSQIDELDADMFASDICMGFIHKYLNLIGDDIRVMLMNSYISFLWHSAKIEEKKNIIKNTNPNSSHPSSKYRVIYLMLRQKKYYEKLNMTLAIDLINQFEKEKNNLMYYDYTKDFGTHKLFK